MCTESLQSVLCTSIFILRPADCRAEDMPVFAISSCWAGLLGAGQVLGWVTVMDQSSGGGSVRFKEGEEESKR